MEKKVSIVIPNYNGEAFLKDCLLSLKDQTFRDIEVIVVDNGSTDNSLETVKSVYGDAQIIKLDKNYGFSAAVNRGIRASSSELVILLNNDTRADKGFVEALYKAVTRDKRIFSVSARMLKMDDPGYIDSAGDLYCCLGWAFSRGKDKPAGAYDKRTDIFSACAGAAIYRKTVFDKIGYFDEKHFAYLEDVDLGYRARIEGYRNVYEPGAVVLHAGSGASGSRYNSFKISLSARNSIYVPYKNMPAFQLILNLPFIFAGTVIKAAFFTRMGEGKTYLSGVRRGLALCCRGRKYPYNIANTLNYVIIQLELWINLFKRFVG